MENFYDILGVDNNATQEQIKQAYRQKVKELHPDVNPSGEEELKSVNEAYATLRDDNKRAKYDRPKNSFSNFTMNNAFRDIFGEYAVHNNTNLPVNVPVDIMMRGGKVSSIVMVPSMNNEDHYIFPQMIMQRIHIEFTVPKHAYAGQFIIVTEAEHGHHGLGDFHLIIRPAAGNVNCEVIGNTINQQIELDVFDVMLGRKVDVLLVTGDKVRITIPPNITVKNTIRIANMGFYIDTANRGDVNLYVTFKIPELSDDQKKRLKAIF